MQGPALVPELLGRLFYWPARDNHYFCNLGIFPAPLNHLSGGRKETMHFNPETALNLLEGTTSEAERLFWDKHIESCSECVVELCEWSTLAGWVKRPHLMSAPEDVLASAKEMVKAPRKTPEFRPPL